MSDKPKIETLTPIENDHSEPTHTNIAWLKLVISEKEQEIAELKKDAEDQLFESLEMIGLLSGIVNNNTSVTDIAEYLRNKLKTWADGT